MFTVSRWNSNPWKLWCLLCIMWASMWQVIDGTHAYISVANGVGAFILFVSLHITDNHTRYAVERWAYLPLVWSMSVYLSLALVYEGFMGLVRQENLGVMLTFGIVMGSIHRFIWLGIRSRIVKRRACQNQVDDDLITEAQAIIRHYTQE